MGQKANPISLQVGTKTGWSTEFAEKKPRDTGVVYGSSKNTEKFLKHAFIKNGFQLQDLKIKHLEGVLKVFVHLYSGSLVERDKKKIFIRSKAGLTCSVRSINTAPNITALLIKVLSFLYPKNKKIIVLFRYANKTLKLKNKAEIKKNLMSLRRFRKQKFYKGGAEAAFAVSKNINFLPVLMNFLIKHIKKMRKINRLVKFLQKFFKLVIKSSNYPIKGVKIKIKGRINGANRARTRFLIVGDVPCNSVNTNLKHMSSHLHNRKGSLGLKIWLAEEQI